MKKILFSLLLLLLASGMAMAGTMSGAPAEAAALSQEGGATITLNITKTNWAAIGNQNGESIGTARLVGASGFDHLEADIRCAEDPEQYITFANVNTNGGALTCYAWEGGRYDLNKGYHYTLTVKAFDVPYYGVDPIATVTYEFVGTGKAAQSVVDIAATISNTREGAYGYIMPADGKIEITFTAPVKNAKAWIAMGQDGSQNVTISQKDGEGKVWSVDLASLQSEEGSIELNVTAYDKVTGDPIRGDNSVHSFPFTISCNPEGGELDPIDEQGDLALTATDGGKYYATFSCDRDVLVAVGDAEVKTVSINEEGAVSLDGFPSGSYKNTNGLQVEGAYYIPAHTGVVVVSGNGNIHYTYAAAPDNSAPISRNANLLRASSVAMEGDCKFYKLAYDNYAEKTGLGFYWGAADGAAFTAKQGGAYLAVPAAQAVKGYTLDGGVVDAMEMVEAEGQKAIYNIQGQRMQQAQKGINIVGGRKVLVK